MTAVSKNRLKIVKILLDNGADPDIKDKDGGTVLSIACGYKYLQILKLLIEKGADPNTLLPNYSDMPVLDWAICSRDKSLIKLIINKGANPNILHGSSSPLMSSIYYEDIEIIKLLLIKGANPNIKNKDGQTPLSFAKKSNNQAITRLLKKYGARE